ncbi:MAG: family 16 glycosylhydrolase, partial [Acutalibacteraceae bacterium]
LQLYVDVDGRNSWTEDGVLHIRGQREQGDGYDDPRDNSSKNYRWTADGLRSSYFDTETGKSHFQNFRFGMMEAKIYTVNGAARVDQNGDPVYDKDGNIQEDPAYSQGLWNGFWTCGNADMSDEASLFNFDGVCWPYTGEIDICESATDSTQFCTYDYSKQDTLTDENGVVFKFNNGQYYIKHDANSKTLITDKSGNTVVSYDADSNGYVIADGVTDFVILTEDDGTEYIEMQKNHDIKQEENSDGIMRNYVLDKKLKTIVDTDGNCYGTANMASAQYHHHTGTMVYPDGSRGDVVGASSNVKACNLYAGYSASEKAGAGYTTIGDSGFHTYGIFWTPTQMVYYVDNSITGVYDISSPEYRALRECPQFALLTFPIGPASPNPALQYADYIVDYVRIYQADDSEYGDTNSLDYKGAKGFPNLNELNRGYDTVNNCVDLSYYQPAIDAYSHINIICVGDEKEVEISGDNCYRQGWGGTPFLTFQPCVSVRSSAKFTTKKSLAEGKYDVYLQGLSRYYGKDYAVTLNGTDIGSQLKMYSDHLKDRFGRSYGGMAEAYVGTAEITNGAHNLTLSLKETYRPNDIDNTVINGGIVRAIIAVGNSKNTATVTIDDSQPVSTTTATTNTTSAATTAAPTTVSTEITPIYDNYYYFYSTNGLSDASGQWEVNDKGKVFSDRNSHGFQISTSKDVQLYGRAKFQDAAGSTIPSLDINGDKYLESGKYTLIAIQYVSGSVG